MIATGLIRRHHPSCPARRAELGCICPPSASPGTRRAGNEDRPDDGTPVVRAGAERAA